VAWYRREQWERLLEIASDREQLEDTFDEWQELAEETLRKLTKEGLTPRKVEVDVEELLKWCQEQGLPVDGKARSQFAVLKLQEQE
jgi:hypothetical protein